MPFAMTAQSIARGGLARLCAAAVAAVLAGGLAHAQAPAAPTEFAEPGTQYRALYADERGVSQAPYVNWSRIFYSEGRPDTLARAFFRDLGLGFELALRIEDGPPFFDILVQSPEQLPLTLVGLRTRERFADAGTMLAGSAEPLGLEGFRFQLTRGQGSYNRAALAGNLLDVILRYEDSRYATITLEISDRARHYLISVWGVYAGALGLQ